MILRIPLPEYRPDQSVHSGVLVTAENVFPAADGYRPVNDITALTDALTGTFQGGSSAIALDGDAYLLAGTGTDLYSLDADGSWTSLIGSLTVPLRWRFTQFGNYVVAVNGADTLEVDLDAATATAISGAPTFTSIAVVGDYVVGGQPNGDINKVRWSAFRDHTGWTNGTDQAGELEMLTGGSVQYIAGGEYGIILQRERIVRMTRTGDATAPFQFDEISVNYGCADGATVAQAGRTIFFYSDRGFVALDDGQALRNIGSEKVDRTFAASISRDALSTIYTAIDPQNKLVFWGIPGSPGTLWIYNFELDRWATAQINFTGIFPGFTTSVKLDDLDGLGYTDLDTMTISLDDPRWSGGNPRLYLIDEDSKAGVLSGDTLAADIELGYTEISEGRRARVRNVRPITDATGGLTVKLNCKARMGDANNIKTATSLRASGIMPIRNAGRYTRTSLLVAGGTVWNYLQGLEIEFEPGGER
jgi:hypothetical protein